MQTLSCRVVNNQQLTWYGGNIQTYSGGFTNNPAATFTISLSCCNSYLGGRDRRMNLQGATASFDNYGLVTTSASSDIGHIGIPFNNNGTVTTAGQALYISNGGYSSGVFQPGSAQPIVFESGTSTLSSLSSITSGVVAVTGGVVNVRSSFQNSGYLRVAGGLANLLSGVSFTNTTTQSLQVTGGTLLFHYGINLDHPALLIGGGTLDLGDAVHDIQDVTQSGGTLTGTQNATIWGTYRWTGGAMAGVGTTVVQGKLLVSSASSTTFARDIVNYNLTQWTSGSAFASSGARFVNWNNATFQADPNAQGQCFCTTAGNAPGVFDNFGLVTKSSYAAFRSYFTMVFNNNGASALVSSTAGNLALAGGGSCASSRYEAGAGGQVSFDGSDNTDQHTLATTCRLTGSGNFKFTGGVSNVFADLQSTNDPIVDGGVVNFREGVKFTSFGPTLRVSAGTANFEQLPVPFPAIALTGGTLDLEDWNVTIPSGAQSNGVLQGSGRVTIPGAYTWSGGNMGGAGATVFDGTLQILTGTVAFGFSRPVINNNLTQWIGGNGVGIDAGVFVNSPNALFEIVQPAGTGFSITLSGSNQARFENHGVVRSRGAAVSARIGLSYNNFNHTEVTSGRLELFGGSYSAEGDYQALTGGILAFGNAVVDVNATIRGDAASTIEFASGVNNVYCSFINPGRLWITGGYTKFPKAGMQIDGDHYVLSPGVVFASDSVGSALQVSGGTVDLTQWDLLLPALTLDGGELTGSGELSLVKPSTWSSGYMTGTGKTLVIGTTLTLTTIGEKHLARLLRNFGNVREFIQALNLVLVEYV